MLNDKSKIILKWRLAIFLIIVFVIIAFVVAIYSDSDTNEERRIRKILKANQATDVNFTVTKKLKKSELSGRINELNSVHSYLLPYGRIYFIKEAGDNMNFLYFDWKGDYFMTCNADATSDIRSPICVEFYNFIFGEPPEYNYDFWFLPDGDGSDSGTYREWVEEEGGGGVGVIRYGG